MRSVSWLSLVVGLLLIPAAAAIALREHDGAREQQQERLDSAATTQAAAVAAYFTRARSIILLTANAAPFREAATEAGGRLAIVARHSAALREATEHLTYLEHLYPSSIGEACFIVSGGGELARVVHGRIARAARLSPDESQTVFFRPTFDQPADGAYQAVPYRSPDVNDWVISNSAPVYARGATRPVAIVHFEVTVESFRRALATAAVDEEELRIVDQRTGAVIAEADQPQRAGAPLGNPGDRRFASLPASGHARVDGRLASVRPLDRQPGNANHWVVVASGASPFPSLLGDLGPAPIGLLIGGLALIAFAALTLRAARRELDEAAHSDPLTGLPNRRSLMADLDRAVAQASDAEPCVLMLFDLDGFKGYNDAYGHVAGDALLARLGARMTTAVESFGRAYRLGGDEFCIIGDGRRHGALARAASAALAEGGEGFAVTSSFGSVLIPAETGDPIEALRLADQRMYQHKDSGRAGADAQSKAVLLRMLVERDPDLGEHVGGVAALAGDVATELGLADEERTDLVHAAELHDIGKMAVPDAILSKPEPLDEAEWAFMRTHTLIGERILCAAPALKQAARIVRSSHERWDGGGYPDGLAGEDIPLGARVVFACDAFDAMVSDRPYAPPRTLEQALAELHEHAGTQFDPAVVGALAAVLARRAVLVSA